jgi:antitoxin MazE
MKTSLIRIGNSQGVRIPKALVEQCGLAGEVELSVRAGSVVVSPAKQPRRGWAAAFKAMAAAGDDAPLWPDGLANEWDERDWTW